MKDAKARIDAAMEGFAEETDACFRKVAATLSAKPDIPPQAPGVGKAELAMAKAAEASKNGFAGLGPTL